MAVEVTPIPKTLKRRRTLDRLEWTRITGGRPGTPADEEPGVFLVGSRDGSTGKAVYTLAYHGFPKDPPSAPKSYIPRKRKIKQSRPAMIFSPAQLDNLIEGATKLRQRMIELGLKHEGY